MTIKELLLLWETEKNAYQTKEIGSGVQFFVKKVLQCRELFNLKEGKLSSADNEREQEFLEEHTKKQKRADIVIFVTNEIIIPLEVERLGNIQTGEKQLFEYQLVWDKKTGILTDGNEWIFYISKTPVKSFFINDILKNPSDFLLFWKEYTQAVNYYLNFFTSNKQEEKLNIEKNRQNFFTDITTLINNFKTKLNLKGYFSSQQNTDSNKQAVEISYAYLIQFILYKTLVDNDFAQFKSDFEERQKRLLKNLSSQNFGDILTVTKAISNKISTNIYRPFKDEQNIINKKIENILDKPRNELHEVSPWLDIFVFVQRYNFADIQNEIFGFIYENYLKQLYDEKLGQYFTSPEVSDFMLEQIGYSGKNLSKLIENNTVSIIDPSCGSGTFLYGAVRNLMECIPNGSLESSKRIEKFITNNIFGIDVAEFPLYLAEMSIIMRMLPVIINEKYNHPIDKKLKIFKTKDTVSEFLDTDIRNTLSDENVRLDRNKGQMDLFSQSLNLEYDSFVRDKSDLEDLKRSLENRSEPRIARYRFDYVIGNPPYISYNECAAQGVLVFDFIKQKKVNLNNIYGVNLHSVPEHPKKYRPNPNLYAFFIAVGLSLLKDGGKMCYIIPQTLLSAGDLDVLRYHLAKFVTIEKMTVFNNKMFTGRGLKQNKEIFTSSLIILIQKLPPSQEHETIIIQHTDKTETVDECLHNIRSNENITTHKIQQKKLLQNFKNWNYVLKPKEFDEICRTYEQNSEKIDIYFKHDLSKNRFNSKFIFDSGYDIDDKEILQNIPAQSDYYCYPRLLKQYYTIKEFRGFFPNNRDKNKPYFIKLRQANQAYELLDCSFKIIWSYSNPHHFFFSDKKLIWPRNQICAIGSENKKELMYLFALLNSSVIRYLLESYLKNENEKNLQISTSSIKEFVRVPLINENNQFIKDEIIKLTEKVLDAESSKLSDFVDFSQVMTQKFDAVSFSDNCLLLHHENQILKCKIRNNPSLVEQFVVNFKTKDKLLLNDLKSMLCIDIEQLTMTMQAINQLMFSLYFNIPITSFENVNEICRQHHLYQYIFKEK